MTRLKTDFQNCLGLTRLDACLQISKGVDLAYFNPDMAISIWHNKKKSFTYNTTQTPKKTENNKTNQRKYWMWQKYCIFSLFQENLFHSQGI